MIVKHRWRRRTSFFVGFAHLTAAILSRGDVSAATYHVAQAVRTAADSNPGTEAAPWKTIARAAAAKELKPGDTVLVHSGVYRENIDVKVSGEPGQPITLAAAPGSRVVVKGSEVVRGPWTRLAGKTGRKEPYPNAFADVWKIPLDEPYFTDARFQGCYQDKSRRWVSQVFVNDDRPLQRIGADPIYKNEDCLQLATIGRGVDDLVQDSFFFDPADQTLYLKMAGEPGWFSIEVGVRGFLLTAEKVHDVVLRGLEFRHNRQPGGQWSMVSIGNCERVTVEDCRFHLSDFCGLSMGRCRDCTLRNCDLSCNGNTGLGMGECQDCLVERCSLLFNNYRRFHAGWHCGGMKCIPANLRCTVRNCEAAYNIASDGIWFDSENGDIRILGNVCHHNDGAGIFFEINKKGGIIADNLVYANRGRGIYISGSQNTWIVHNTVACNESGIICMPRGDDWPLENVRVQNNLLVRNYVTADTLTRGCDLTLFMGCRDAAPYTRMVTSNHSDYNVYADTSWTPTMRHSWNPDNTLVEWRERFGEDVHSALVGVDFQQRGTGFTLRTRDGLPKAEPLPDEIRSIVQPPSHIGCSRSMWPVELGGGTASR
ncbi:MAG: right-handed parallel beta-helix repeat-containing protein [Thermoguttaceae bacterium]